MEDRLQQALANIRDEQEKMSQAKSELAAARSSVTSPDHMVTATVGARGELHELKFHLTKYRSMPPDELSHVLVTVINKARAQMTEKVVTTFQPMLANLVNVRAAMSADTEVEQVFSRLWEDRPDNSVFGTGDGSHGKEHGNGQR
jgi:DNA-binding protein YbaB